MGRGLACAVWPRSNPSDASAARRPTRLGTTSPADRGTKTIATAVRSHWGIDYQVHWVLDVAFREDMSRSRLGHSAQNLALLRKLALNLIRLEPTRKIGVKGSRLKAGWDNDYLFRVLGVE